MQLNFSVAIDGPAGAGKSTIAKLLSKRFNLMYINTGAMYRTIALKAIKKQIKPEEIEKLCLLTDSLEMHFNDDRLIVNNEDVTDFINDPFISQNVSQYAAIPEIRERLVKLQQQMSNKYNVVMDGRDIGTVVLKNAAFKFFLTAAPEERAKRRYDELVAKGLEVNYDSILSDIIKRDYVDSHREASPLVKAEDAIEVDSSYLSIDQVVDKMTDYIVNTMNSISK
ncbi:MAG: (d)CMP kinase [Bacillota bacterium]|nr:(d)CMP kinase [Bacillota bacterium]